MRTKAAKHVSISAMIRYALWLAIFFIFVLPALTKDNANCAPHGENFSKRDIYAMKLAAIETKYSESINKIVFSLEKTRPIFLETVGAAPREELETWFYDESAGEEINRKLDGALEKNLLDYLLTLPDEHADAIIWNIERGAAGAVKLRELEEKSYYEIRALTEAVFNNQNSRLFFSDIHNTGKDLDVNDTNIFQFYASFFNYLAHLSPKRQMFFFIYLDGYLSRVSQL